MKGEMIQESTSDVVAVLGNKGKQTGFIVTSTDAFHLTYRAGIDVDRIRVGSKWFEDNGHANIHEASN